MLPSELTRASFAAYSPQAQAIAVKHLALLQQLPIVFVALFLREIISYDVRFPAEQRTIDDQFSYLESLSSSDRNRLFTGFASLTLSQELNAADWVHDPQRFSETLTAHLWATGQLEAFRTAADQYSTAWHKAIPESQPEIPRLSLVLIGSGASSSSHPLFRKLRPHGVYFPNVDPANGLSTMLQTVAARAKKHPAPYQHWYIDGGAPVETNDSSITSVSYANLAETRAAILHRMQNVIASGQSGPEALRTMMAQMRPEDVGMSAKSSDAVLNQFKISVLTEGSGTQIFSTTFAQWSAREALRRAQPVTLLLRFAPRQRQRPMNELLAGTNPETEFDPEGSLVDADMGAYYTWINQQRLTGADRSAFLVWFEKQNQALAIAPTLPRGTASPSRLSISQILASIT